MTVRLRSSPDANIPDGVVTRREVSPAIGELLHLLEQEYGTREWQPGEEAVSVLVRTILSQNTSDTNSGRAFASLLAAFGDWEAITASDPQDIARSINQGGLANIKAIRIKLVLQRIQERQGSLALDFLKRLPLPEAKAWLRELPGVGPKTASCVLLFALGKPALPVDTHVLRVSKRLGLVDSRVSAEAAQELLEALVPPQHVYQFHVHLIEHGRKVCQAQRPRCNRCVLRKDCPSYMSRN